VAIVIVLGAPFADHRVQAPVDRGQHRLQHAQRFGATGVAEVDELEQRVVAGRNQAAEGLLEAVVVGAGGRGGEGEGRVLVHDGAGRGCGGGVRQTGRIAATERTGLGPETRPQWNLCWALPVSPDGAPSPLVGDVLHAPTPTAERLTLPARLIATVLVLPLLTAVADLVGLIGGYIVAHFTLGLSAVQFWNRAIQALAFGDLVMGLAKPVVFAVIIATVACFYGLRTRGGTQGVGRATTQAVVAASVFILVTDFFVTKLLISILSYR